MLGEAEKPLGNAEALAASCEVDGSVCSGTFCLYLISVICFITKREVAGIQSTGGNIASIPQVRTFASCHWDEGHNEALHGDVPIKVGDEVNGVIIVETFTNKNQQLC